MLESLPDDVIGRFVVDHMLATAAQVDSAREFQADQNRRGFPLSLVEAMVRLGVITPAQREGVEQRVQIQQKQVVQQLLHYRLERKVGEGGMGVVYLARDTHDDRTVALKVLARHCTARPDFMRRFQREADAAGRLNHPHIARAYSFGEDRGRHFYVMEYCEGETLDRRIKRDAYLPPEEATRLVLQIARGLKYAHERGVVHRDIKPSNIVVSPAGEAKILDLGLSKRLEEAESAHITLSGVAMGTPHYMSPEQARGERSIDGRADIYSLGATYYHLLTGETPFHGTSAFEIVTKHLHEQLPDPRDLREEIPDGVVHVIRRMMAKKPTDRYPDCGALLKDLERVSGGEDPASLELDSTLSAVALPRRPRPGRRRFAGATPAKQPTAGVPVLAPGHPVHRAHPAPAQAGGRPAARAPRWTAYAILGGFALAVMIPLLALALKGGPDSGLAANAGFRGTSRPGDKARPIPAPAPAVAPSPPVGGAPPDREAIARGELNEVRVREGTMSPGERLRVYETLARHHQGTRAGREALEFADHLRAQPAPPPVPQPEKGAQTAAGARVDESWLRFVRALSAAEQVAEIQQKMRGMNPGFNEGVSYNVDGDRLADLSFSALHVQTLEPLRPLKALRSLRCTGRWSSNYQERQKGRGALRDLAPLRDLPLQEVDVTLTQVDDLAPLRGLPLKKLACVDTPVQSLEALRGAPLEILQVGATPIDDLSALSGMMQLRELQCSYTKVRDLSPLRGLRLVRLFCDHAEVVDLSPLRGMTSLRELSCDFPGSGNAEILRTLTGLEKINGQEASGFFRRLDETSAFARAEISLPADADWSKAVNVLPLVDPDQDAVAGLWTVVGGELISDRTTHDRIEIPYQPPESYWFRVHFTRQEGDGDVVLILSQSGRSFAWQMGAERNTVFGFNAVLNLDLNANPTAVRADACLETGRAHTSIVQVRPDGVRAYLDGRLVGAWQTDFRDLGSCWSWKVRDETLLGLGSYYNRVVFHRVEVLEAGGRGRVTRGAEGPPSIVESSPAVPVAFAARVVPVPRRVDPAVVEREMKRLHDEAVRQALDECRAVLRETKAPDARVAAVAKLAATERDARIVSELARALQDIESVRIEALAALGRYRRNREAAKAVVGSYPLCAKSVSMQVRCLSALAMIGHESALPLAAKLLGHPEAKVAAEAARVLGEISVASAAIPLLVAWEEMEKDRKKSGDAAKSAEERLRILGSPLKDALARLTGQRFDSPDDVRKWLVSNRIPGQPPEELPEAGCVHLLQIELARREAKGNPPGVIVRELWRGIRGKTLEAFAASGALACPATDFDLLAGFETPYNIGDNYGSRIRGYLRPPVDGEYQFWICSDNNAELYLGADDSPAGKSLIAWIRGTAYNTGWAEPRNWERYPSQLSKPVRLAAGRCYYIEALQKEEDGGDHLAVAWQVPGGSREVIPGRCLSPYLVRPARTGDDGLDRGPVAWWRFNESAGITAFDSSGNDHTGSLTGGPAWDAAGKQGGALRLDGVDDDVRVSRSSDLEPASVTVSAWIRLDGAPPSWANLLRKTWRNRAGPTSASYALQLNPEGADPGMIAFVTGYEGGNDILKSPKASIPGGAWVHVAGTYDPGAPVPQKRLYVNGELVAFKTLTRPLVYDTTATGDLYLGQNGSRSERFKGWLDDVQVHDRALPAEEIRAALAPVAAR